MRKTLSLLLMITLLLSIGTTSLAASVPAEKAVFRLQALGIIGEYEAEHIVTRAQAVSAFVKMVVGDVSYSGETGFKDVTTDNEYAGAIYYARQIGIINGTSTGVFDPDSDAMGLQIAKMAVTTLGYQEMAEDEGGYPDGYTYVAAQQGLLTGYELGKNVTMAEFAVLLDKILDMNTLESSYGSSGDYVKSDSTIYETMIQRSSKERLNGIVTAVGNSALNGFKPLKEDEISIGETIFQYNGENAYNMLGRNVYAYYKEDDAIGRLVIVDMMQLLTNKEITIKNNDLTTLTRSSCIYEQNEDRKKTQKIGADASFIYNRSNYIPLNDEIQVRTGNVRLLDKDNDDIYDVVFIEEFESFVADRISSINTTVYFKKDVFFRGKAGFKFDYEDTDKEYHIYDESNQKITFEDITTGSVITVESNFDETINYVTVSTKTVSGVINEISEDDIFVIDEQEYEIYAPNTSELRSNYGVGQEGTFYLNEKDEIVDAEVGADGDYGFVVAASAGSGIGRNAQIKIITNGTSQKEIEVNGDEETIKYNYTNGEEKVLDLASRIRYTTMSDVGGKLVAGSETSVSSSSLNWAQLSRAAVSYKLDAEGKVYKLTVAPIDKSSTVKINYDYKLNGKLNSFGGASRSPAFFVGKTTNVICIPENDNPNEKDYEVDVTVVDKTPYAAIPINIDDKTQIAECVILVVPMDATKAKPFTASTKISIVGSVKRSVDENGELLYTIELLTGKKYETPYLKSGALMESAVSNLKCGDLIQYNTNALGEIANVSKVLASMYEKSNIYDVSNPLTANEMAYGPVASIELNRLDGEENELVDVLEFSSSVGATRAYKILREDGPVVYSYRKSTGVISVAETDEILTENEVGAGASKVFLYVVNNIVKCVVIFKD